MTATTSIKRNALGWALAGLLGSGCGHDPMGERTSDVGAHAGSTFGEAWDAVRSGARDVARFGEYVFDRTSDGVVRVYHEVRGGEPTQQASSATSDTTTTAKVQATLAADAQLDSRNITVETDAGVVTLGGMASSREQAARAVEDAAHTSGVYAVNSKLTFPPPARPTSMR